MSAQTVNALFARAIMLDAIQRASNRIQTLDFLEIPLGEPFNVEPSRALAYFRAKGLKVTFDYRELVGDAHDQAFTVAKMMDIDLLRQVRDSLGDALQKGTSFNEWKKSLMPDLQKAGWLPDPSNRSRRLDTIFRTNMQSAYAAEQWEQIQQQKEVAPYLLYDAVDDERTRPMHKLWDNTCLPIDHEFWKTHYPPNGYNCRCTVLQLSGHELDAMGIVVDSKAPDTGNEGIDEGFDRNVGTSLKSALNSTLKEKLQTLPDALRAQVQASIVQQKSVFDRRVRRGLLGTPQAPPPPRDFKFQILHKFHIGDELVEGIASEHTTRALAEKARGRLVAMSKGKMTAADFPIKAIDVKAVPGDTLTQWTDAAGNIKPERLKLHDEIVAKFLKEVKPSAEPTLTFLGGGSAAGKSNILSSLPQRASLTLDVDEIRKLLPEYQADTKSGIDALIRGAGARTHEESSLLMKRIGREAAALRSNLTLDGTGDGGIEKLAAKVQQYRALGQRIEAHYVTSSTEEALARANARGQKTGRFVPEPFIREIHRDVSIDFPKAIERGLFDKFSLWDTTGSTAANKAAKLIASGEGTRLTIHDREAWERFLAKGRVIL